MSIYKNVIIFVTYFTIIILIQPFKWEKENLKEKRKKIWMNKYKRMEDELKVHMRSSEQKKRHLYSIWNFTKTLGMLMIPMILINF